MSSTRKKTSKWVWGVLFVTFAFIAWVVGKIAMGNAIHNSIENIAQAIESTDDTSVAATATANSSDTTFQVDPLAVPAKRYTVLDFSADMAKSVGVENGMPKADALTKMDSYFTRMAEGGVTTEREDDVLASGITRTVITQTGLLDDSVTAHQFIAMFKTAYSGEEALFNYGLRIKCGRPDSSDTWQNTPCP